MSILWHSIVRFRHEDSKGNMCSIVEVKVRYMYVYTHSTKKVDHFIKVIQDIVWNKYNYKSFLQFPINNAFHLYYMLFIFQMIVFYNITVHWRYHDVYQIKDNFVNIISQLISIKDEHDCIYNIVESDLIPLS